MVSGIHWESLDIPWIRGDYCIWGAKQGELEMDVYFNIVYINKKTGNTKASIKVRIG